MSGTLWLLALGEAQAGNFIPGETSLFDRVFSLLGIAVMVGIAWLLSTDRRAIAGGPCSGASACS